jgi:hypothetical protein
MMRLFNAFLKILALAIFGLSILALVYWAYTP